MNVKQKDYFDRKRIMLKKYVNYLSTLNHLARKDIFLHNHPFQAFINPTTACNYKCPYCARGNNTLGVGFMDMPLALFKKILDQIGDYLIQLNLFFYGEPFLNKDIFEMIRYAKKFFIYIRVNSNFSNFNEAMIKELIQSDLDQIIFSIDGISQETYEKYRVGGDLNNVINNLKELVNMKRQLNSNKPRATWQFLVFSHNVHEIEEARRMCFSLGLDDFWLFEGDTPDTKEGREMRAPDHISKRYGLKRINDIRINELKNKKRNNSICQWPWAHLIINEDGKISPCCTYHENTDIFGDFSKKSFREIWNSDTFIAARRYFSRGEKNGPNIFCFDCPIEDKCRLLIPLDSSCRTLSLKVIDRLTRKILKI